MHGRTQTIDRGDWAGWLGRAVMWNADIKLARSFLAVANGRSVTEAARALNSTQPTISGHLKELESQLGFTLFERSTRRMELTQDGADILPQFTRMIACADDLEFHVRKMQDSHRGTFRLAATMYTIDFPERTSLLKAFEESSPGIIYTVENYLQGDQIPRLISGNLDASLLLGMTIPLEEYEKIIRDSDNLRVANELIYPKNLKRVVIGYRRVEMLVPEESSLAKFDIIPVAELNGWTVSMLGPGHGAPLLSPIIDILEGNGARVYIPADTNAVAVNHYAWQHRIPSIDLGWHGKPSGPPGEMVRRPIEGLGLTTEFAVVLGLKPASAACKLFSFAQKFAQSML